MPTLWKGLDRLPPGTRQGIDTPFAGLLDEPEPTKPTGVLVDSGGAQTELFRGLAQAKAVCESPQHPLQRGGQVIRGHGSTA